MKTSFLPTEKAQWYLADATDRSPGRLATEVAIRLRGKHRPDYAPGVDLGDSVIVINAAKVKITGNKKEGKIYYRHSGYPGALKEEKLGEVLQKKPENVILRAVKGMLPKGPLGRQMMRRLRVYANAEHPHSGQSPIDLKI